MGRGNTKKATSLEEFARAVGETALNPHSCFGRYRAFVRIYASESQQSAERYGLEVNYYLSGLQFTALKEYTDKEEAIEKVLAEAKEDLFLHLPKNLRVTPNLLPKKRMHVQLGIFKIL